MDAIYNTKDKRQPELGSPRELKQRRPEEIATATKLVHVDNNQLPPLVIMEEGSQVVELNLLTVAPEIQLLILQQCDSMALSRIDQACKALSTPMPPCTTVTFTKSCSEQASFRIPKHVTQCRILACSSCQNRTRTPSRQ